MSLLHRLTLRIPLTSIEVSLHHAADHQRGFWIDCEGLAWACIGLGGSYLQVARSHGLRGPLVALEAV